MSSGKMSSEINKRFNRNLSSGLIRRYRRKFGSAFGQITVKKIVSSKLFLKFSFLQDMSIED